MRRPVAFALLATVLAALAFVSAAYADPNNNNSAKLRAAVTLEGVRAHQLALQQIATANGGNRFSGLPGYDKSVAYVVEKLKAAGYDPVVQPFDYLAYGVVGPSVLQQTAPGSITYVEGVDFGPIEQTDPGDVTAPVTAVDLQLGLGNTSTSGCEAADFAGFPAGNIALLQRGTCTFELKAENAAAAGAVGIVIFNQGNTAAPDRNGIPAVTLTANNTSGIPVLGTTYALGVTLAGTPGLAMRVFANTVREIKTTFNVLAELPGKNPDNVVMVGGHLDSVIEGPGINDNGSGSAAILEVAEQMEKVKPWNTVRFAWWGAEESSLVGSTFYVDLARCGGARPDRALPQLRHDRLAELRPLRLRRQRGHRPDRSSRLRRDRGRLQRVLRRERARHRADGVRRSVGLPGHSSTTASPPAACSRAQRGSRRRRRRRCTEARPVRPTTRATTRPATRSRTTAPSCSTRCRTRSHTQRSRSPRTRRS